MSGCDVRVVSALYEGVGLKCAPCHGVAPFIVWDPDLGHADPTLQQIEDAAEAHRLEAVQRRARAHMGKP